MLLDIIHHTPAWVFGVLALLLVLGGRQLRPHRLSLMRATLMPLAMIALAVWGVVSAFGSSAGLLAVAAWAAVGGWSALSAFGQSPAGLLAIAAWAVAASVSLLIVSRLPLPGGVRYDAGSGSLHMPGSAVPLLLMMAIFMTKYVVGVSTALHPEWADISSFALGVSTLYGLFSGIFAGRALRLWRLVQFSEADAPLPTTSR